MEQHDAESRSVPSHSEPWKFGGVDMIRLIAQLADLEADAQEKYEQATEKERLKIEDAQRAMEAKREATEEKRSAWELLRKIRQIRAESEAWAAGGGESSKMPESEGIEADGAERQVGMGHEEPPWIFNADFGGFLPPAKDANGEPIYSKEIVAGKGSHRERAVAVAMVHGPEVRESSLSKAIYETGDTGAADPGSVRASLGSLVRYGSDWRRERGWLVYTGPRLVPDKETILRLVEERAEAKAAYSDVDSASGNSEISDTN